MKSLLGFLFLMPLLVQAQKMDSPGSQDTNTINVEWSNNLTWKNIKAKAKKENKYIFIDCYATWCVPCKKMDKHVYSNDSASSFLNSNFISVKVQMDTSQHDNEEIRKWYSDASSINKEYNISAYPTFLSFLFTKRRISTSRCGL
jgi:thiol:disulfide interchange protein